METLQNRTELEKMMLGVQGGIVTSIDVETVSEWGERYTHTITTCQSNSALGFRIFPDCRIPKVIYNSMKKKTFPTAQMAADYIAAVQERFDHALKTIVVEEQ